MTYTFPYPWEATLAEADPRIVEAAEDWVVRTQGPLTRTTTEAGWVAYSTAVADWTRHLSAK